MTSIPSAVLPAGMGQSLHGNILYDVFGVLMAPTFTG